MSIKKKVIIIIGAVALVSGGTVVAINANNDEGIVSISDEEQLNYDSNNKGMEYVDKDTDVEENVKTESVNESSDEEVNDKNVSDKRTTSQSKMAQKGSAENGAHKKGEKPTILDMSEAVDETAKAKTKKNDGSKSKKKKSKSSSSDTSSEIVETVEESDDSSTDTEENETAVNSAVCSTVKKSDKTKKSVVKVSGEVEDTEEANEAEDVNEVEVAEEVDEVGQEEIESSTENEIDIIDDTASENDIDEDVENQQLSYTVTLMYDEGEGIYEDFEIKEGECFEEPEEPEDSERIFIGWFYVNQKTGEMVEYDFNSPVMDNITLYTVWEDPIFE